MAEIIRMPEILAGAEEAAIQTWLVGPGSLVAIGQVLAEIETDKAIVELEAEAAGKIGRLLIQEGDTVAVGEPILALLAEGETEDAVGPALEAAGILAPSRASAPQVTPPTEQAARPAPPEEIEHDRDESGAGDSPSERRFVSPIVRKLAAEAGVSLDGLEGTGPSGRVVRRDLQRHLSSLDASSQGVAGGESVAQVPPEQQVVAGPVQSQPTPACNASGGADYTDVPLDRMRKTIARRLTESKSSVPHFYLVADCRVDALLELRRTVNDQAPRKISVNDFVLKAVAQALVDVPAANAIWNTDSIRQFSSVDISVAVATEGGLMTPVLRGVERLPLGEISSTVADLASRAREGRLKQNELQGGSFAVSNLGMFGTSEFSAILNPPQSGILAVGAARAMPVVGGDGGLEVGHVMTVTLSADHRVLDGAVAAKWLAAFQRRIENPLSILI